MERFPLNPNRWVEPLFMFACRLGRSTPPSERQFKHHVRLCVPHRLVRAWRCFPHSQTHFENIRTEHLLRNVVRSHPTSANMEHPDVKYLWGEQRDNRMEMR